MNIAASQDPNASQDLDAEIAAIDAEARRRKAAWTPAKKREVAAYEADCARRARLDAAHMRALYGPRCPAAHATRTLAGRHERDGRRLLGEARAARLAAVTARYAPRPRGAGRPAGRRQRHIARATSSSDPGDDGPEPPLVPRDLLRVYREVREHADDAFAAGNLIRVVELLEQLDVLRDLTRIHVRRGRRELAA